MQSRVEQLNQLSRRLLTDAGVKELVGLKQLKTLNLAGTQVTDAGVEQLRGLTKLRLLNLRDTKVTDEGVEKLQQALPKCKIIR